MATNNDDTVKRISYSMTDLRDITDDELPEITKLFIFTNVRQGEPLPAENKPLSQRIGLCTNMKELALVKCSGIPLEISNCTLLSILTLFSPGNNDDGDCRIKLTEGIVLRNLTTVTIKGVGNWNADEIISWLAACCPNLRSLHFYDLTKDNASQFLRSLQDNEVFIDVFQYKLVNVSFISCNLNEDDARSILFDIKPLYPRLVYIDLQNNNIEGFETVGTAVRETPLATINPLLPSRLKVLLLTGNQFLRNLNDPKSPDNIAMILLLKYHQLL